MEQSTNQLFGNLYHRVLNSLKASIVLVFFSTFLFSGFFAQSFSIVGTGTAANTTTTYPAPYGNYYWGSRHQFLITAAELTAAGIPAGATISSLGFNVTADNGATVHTGFQVVVYSTTLANPLATAYVTTGQVSSSTAANYNPVLGWNQHALTPFVWNGTANLVIQTCFNNSAFTTNASTQWTTTLTGTSVKARYRRADATGVCANTTTTATSTTTRPNMRFAWTGTVASCSGTPTAGTASISATSGCSGTSVTLSGTGQTSGTGISYQWQSGPSATGPWTNIAGATTQNTNVTPTANTFYRLNTTCSTSGLTSSTAAVSYTVNTCTASILMTDSFGDGWNGAGMTLNVNGSPFLTFGSTFTTGTSQAINLCLPANSSYSIVYNAGGTYPAEVGVQLTINGALVYSVGAGGGTVGSTLTSGTACPVGCAGTPTGGTAAASITTVCSGSTTALSATGMSTGGGITYQWQSSPDNTTWTNIAGATTATYTATVSSTTYYRLVTTCTNSGLNAASASVLVNTVTCCNYTFRMTDSFGDGWNGATMQVRIGTTVVQTIGASFTTGTSQDVVIPMQGGTAYNLFYVGGGTYPAEVGIQIIDANNTTIYTLTAGAGTAGSQLTTWTATCPTPCSGAPSAANASANPSQVFAGGTTTLSLAPAQASTGMTYQWQSSSDNSSWSNIGGATAATYVASPTAATYYRCVITCSNSGQSTNSGSTLVSFNAYCNPSYTYGTPDGDLISNVVIAGTTLSNNTGTTAGLAYYNFYTGQPNYTANLVAANSYNVSVSAGSFVNQNFAAWIDYNDNNVFEASEKIGFSAAATTVAFETVNFPINLSCTPPLGPHRMRVRGVYATAGSTIDPCANYGWGETEDYIITIVAGSPFTPAFTVTPTNPSCMNSQVTYTATAGQTNYSWVPSGVNGTDYTINSGGTSTSNTITITWLTNGSKTMSMNYASPLGCTSSGAVSNTISISPSIVWANLQWPANATVACGASTNVYGQVYEPSLTPAGGANAGISVQVGVSTTNTNPSTWPASAWTNASYNAQIGNNDEYVGSIGSTLAPGTYYYSFRYSNNGTPCYVYGGFQGGYWNGTSNVNGVLTVNGVDWANLQFPGTGSICQTGTYSVYGQAYEPGVTENAGAGAGLTVQVGINTANTDPSTWASGAWSNATFNTQSGNNDEFMATFASLAPNTYYYTFRYSLGNGCYQYGGFSSTGGGIWNGTTNVSGVLTVNATPIVTASANPTTVCSGQSLTLTGGGAASYTWDNGVTNAVAFNPTGSATYNVVGITAAGCTGTTSITVNLNNLSTTTTPGSGDLIWHGRTNTDYATISNWSMYNGSTYVPSTIAPTLGTNVIIPVNQSCVATQPNTNANNVSALNVTIETGASLTMNNGTLNVAGNWVQYGSFVAGTGTVVFNGSSLATINAPTGSSISFNNLEMNNGGDVSLMSPIAVTGALTLTSGDLILGGNNLNLANASINGGNWNSYVQTTGIGELQRNLTGTLIYPIGRSTYNPVTMSKAGAAYSFGARVVDQVTTNGQDNGTPVSVANVGRMWHINPAAGYTAAANGAVDLTLSYIDNAPYFVNGFVNGSADRQLMHYGAGWENITNVPGAFTTGVDGNNYTWTTQSGVSDFSPFTVTNSTTSLPIELISFQANCNDNKQIEVTWSTASEHNTSHYVVERTRDGINWTTLGMVAAAGNSTQVLEYELLDATSQSGVNYYRLTQYDNDGAFEVFNVAAVTCGEEINSTQLVSYPNPSANSFSVALDTKEMTGTAVLSITDARGSEVYSKTVEIQHGHNVYHIADMTATPGMYYIQVSNGTTSTDIVKHSLR